MGIYDLGMADAEKGSVLITLPEAQSLYNLRDQVTEVSIVLDETGKENMIMPALQDAPVRLRSRFVEDAAPRNDRNHRNEIHLHQHLRADRAAHRQHRHPQPDAHGRLRADAGDGRVGVFGHESGGQITTLFLIEA
ncbi:MAG: hypothetical protein R2873_26245 [Caldilineaceae bacterium]